MFSIEYEDGKKETYNNLEIDVPIVNRQKVKSFFLIESNWFIGMDVKEGVFNLNGLLIPFAFHSATTEFVLFRRLQATSTLEVLRTNPQSVAKVFAIGFGLRNTLPLPDGTTKNHVQLFWLYATGDIKMGGNK